jgi:hypothetical protein
MEIFGALLKRTVGGTYVPVESFHQHRYLDEKCFQFNYRATKDNPLNDTDRFTFAMTQIAEPRLTYATLTVERAESACEGRFLDGAAGARETEGLALRISAFSASN